MADFNRKDPMNDPHTQKVLSDLLHLVTHEIDKMAESTMLVMQGYKKKIANVIDQYNEVNLTLRKNPQQAPGENQIPQRGNRK